MYYFNEFWSNFDAKGTGLISVKDFPDLIKMIIDEELTQIYHLRKEVKDGDISMDDIDKRTIMFNLHKDEILLTVAGMRKEKVFKKLEFEEKD